MTTTSQIPRLRRGVKLIVGMDDQPMLFDTDAGTYHRLGAAADPYMTLVGYFSAIRRRTLSSAVAAVVMPAPPVLSLRNLLFLYFSVFYH